MEVEGEDDGEDEGVDEAFGGVDCVENVKIGTLNEEDEEDDEDDTVGAVDCVVNMKGRVLVEEVDETFGGVDCVVNVNSGVVDEEDDTLDGVDGVENVKEDPLAAAPPSIACRVTLLGDAVSTGKATAMGTKDDSDPVSLTAGMRPSVSKAFKI